MSVFLLFSVSDNTIRKETECFGALQKVCEAAWIQQSQDEDWFQARLQNTGKLAGRLYGSIDGVIAPCKREWREIKNIVWYKVDKVHSYEKRRRHANAVSEQNDLQAYDITYHCDIQSPDKLPVTIFFDFLCRFLANRF